MMFIVISSCFAVCFYFRIFVSKFAFSLDFFVSSVLFCFWFCVLHLILATNQEKYTNYNKKFKTTKMMTIKSEIF